MTTSPSDPHTNDPRTSDAPKSGQGGIASDGCGPLVTTPSVTAKPLRRQLFEAVRSAGTISRIDLSKQLDVSPATITALSTELIEAGFIAEAELPRREDREQRSATRGRPPVGLGVTGGDQVVIGIKISDRENSAVVLDFAGRMLSTATLPAPPERRSTDEVVEEISDLVAAALRAADTDRDALCAVGVGIPGMIDFEAGRVIWCPFMAQADVALRRRLEHSLNTRVSIDNDANMLALAELWFGEGRKLANFAVLSIEHGVGMGYVHDHALQRGGQGHGMELGHVTVQMDGALCRCGKRGCLEAYVADYALVREANTALGHPIDAPTPPNQMLDALFDEAKSGNPAAKVIFERAGRFLATALANVVTLFDPTLILLSGDRLRYDYLYAEEVLNEFNDLTRKPGRPPTPVEIHAWGDLIWAQGAGALALDHATEALLG